MAKRVIFAMFIFCCLLFVEVIYCFEGSIPNVPVLCYGRNIPCRMFNDWAALLFDIILPSICLATFGLMTIRNIRTRVVQPVRRPTTNSGSRLLIRFNDRNLTRMLLIQVSDLFHTLFRVRNFFFRFSLFWFWIYHLALTVLMLV